MGMTIAEKVLARAAGKETVTAGEYVLAKVDRVCSWESFLLIQDGMVEAGIKGGIQKLWDPEKVVVFIDHNAPALDKNVKEAVKHVRLRQLVKRLGIKHFYDVNSGICHQVMVEKGYVLPGSLVVVPDSHATLYGGVNCCGTGIGETEMAWVLHHGELWFQVPPTIKVEVTGKLNPMITGKDIFLYMSGQNGTDSAQYKSIEWTGGAISDLSLDGRLCIANQSVEIGAKFALFDFDEKVEAYLAQCVSDQYTPTKADPDAVYEKIYHIDGSKLAPQVAEPHGMQVVNPADHYHDVTINQATIGGCANGRLEDIALAAEVLAGKRVHPEVRLIVGPASWEVYKEAMEAGYLQTLIDAGAIICHPYCGPCTGGIGVLAPGEVCITSTSRNFKGRLGSPEAFIYLASPATVAASAVTGRITDPREVL